MSKKIAFAILVLSFAMLACAASVQTPQTKAVQMTVEPTANVICTALRGAVTVRDADGRAVTWLAANTPVCVLPGVKQGRLQMADGTGTILAACVLGPRKDCK